MSLHGYGVLVFISSWLLVKFRRKYAVSSLIDTEYWLSEQQILDFFDDENPRQPSEIVKETYANTSPEKQKLIDAEVEVVHMILNGIGNDIYSTMDACPNVKELWIAIQWLQQGESINIQDVKTKLFWEFGKFTSREGESIESYYIKFNRMMNKMVRNKLKVDTMQVNVQFLLQLKPKWSRFMTIVKQAQDLDTNYPDDYYQAPQAPKPYRTRAPSSRQTTLTRSHVTTRSKSKEIDTDDEPDKKELEAHYMYMEKILEVLHVTDDNSEPTYDVEPLEKVHPNDDYNVFANERQHFKQPESINDSYVVENVDSNVIPDLSDMCNINREADQNADKPENKHVLLAFLITNLNLDVDENKKIQKQLKKANTSLTQDLKKNKHSLKDCKFELERYKTFQTNQQDKEIAELKYK
ncbi:hypothetical protein Tco_1393739 [Tanacetum coccineum]